MRQPRRNQAGQSQVYRNQARTAAGLQGGAQLSGETLLGWLDGARGWLLHNLHRENDYRTGFLWLPVAFGIGIVGYFSAAQEPLLWAGPLLALLVLPAVLIARGMLRAGLLSLLFMAMGFSAATIRTAMVASPMLEREHFGEVRGFVETIDDIRHRQRLVLRPTAMEGLAEKDLPFRLRVGTPGKSGAMPGDFVVAKTRLMPPSEAAMPGGYDFRRDSFFRSTGGVGYAIGPVRKETAPTTAPLDLTLNAAVDRWRNTLTDRIARAIGGDAGALSAALITGKRGLISEPANEDLRGAGLYHIVSISGLHMVLAAGVLFWSIRAGLAAIPAIALTHPIKKYAAGAAMVGATFYCIFSGSEVATERSLIMTLVMLGAILVDRPALAMRNLAISALIVLAREPEALIGPSFQMSFAAVGSLIAANQVWSEWKARNPELPRGRAASFLRKLGFAFLGIAATTIVATLATAPFSAYHFHRLNPYGIIGNSLGIPLVSLVVMPAAVIGTVLVPFGLDGFVWRIMGEGVAGVLIVANWVASIENASVTAPNMQGPGFALLVAALMIFIGFRTPLRWAALGLFALWGVTLRAAHAPDIVIDPTGQMALARGENGRYRVLAVGTPSRFTLAQWLPALGDARMPNDPSLRDGVRCDKTGCTTRMLDGRLLALTIRAEGLREDCRRADIVITPLSGIAACEPENRPAGQGKAHARRDSLPVARERPPAGREEPPVSRGKLLAKDHFERYGATKIISRSPSEWRLETSLDPEGQRPWRRQPKPPPKTLSSTPSAMTPKATTPLAGKTFSPELPANRTAETLEDEPGLFPPQNPASAP